MKQRKPNNCISVLLAAMFVVGYLCNGMLFAFFTDSEKIGATVGTGSVGVAIKDLKNSDGIGEWTVGNGTIDEGTVRDGEVDTISFSVMNEGTSTVSYALDIALAFEDALEESGRLLLFPADMQDEEIVSGVQNGDLSGALIGMESDDTATVETETGEAAGIVVTAAEGALNRAQQQAFAFKLLFISGAVMPSETEMYHGRRIVVNISLVADIGGRTTSWAAAERTLFYITTVIEGAHPVLTEVPHLPKTFFIGQSTEIDLAAYATASDETDTDITSRITISSSPAFEGGKAGTYTVTYNVINSAGKAAVPLTVTITVWNFIKTATGNHHSLILTSHGRVYAWGRNVNGQLGDGTKTNKSVPTLIEGLENIVDISACNSSSFALSESGILYSWGHNGWGHLGNGEMTDTNSPQPVLQPEGVFFSKVFARYNTAGAVTTDGEVYTWGYGANGATGTGTPIDANPVPQKLALSDIQSLDFGKNFGAALTADGRLYMWGSNLYGTLGTGSAVSEVYTPIPVPYFESEQNRLSEIDAGNLHMTARTKDGRLFTWGYGQNGRLGYGDTYQQKLPTHIELPVESAHVFAGYANSAVIDADGNLYGFGDNSFGKLGAGDAELMTPTLFAGIAGITYLSLMNEATLILVGGETLYGIGRGEYGIFGNGNSNDTTVPVPWTFAPPPPF